MDPDFSVAREALICTHLCCASAYSCRHLWFLTENVSNTDQDQAENSYKQKY